MTKQLGTPALSIERAAGPKPNLAIIKLGIVSRDYRVNYPNGFRDYSHSFSDILKLLDKEGCDAALFSLYSIIPRKSFNPHTALYGLKNLKTIFFEEFQDKKRWGREAQRYLVYFRSPSKWKEYEFNQIFGTMKGMPKQKINDFVNIELPKRILGNCCVLLCGETNGVKYSKTDKKVHDDFGLRKAIPSNVNVILNPVHDRMTRFEMKLKRQFLSRKKRWVISIWNKGKQDKNGKTKDGNGPAWTAFHDGDEVEVPMIQNDLSVDIGVLDIWA